MYLRLPKAIGERGRIGTKNDQTLDKRPNTGDGHKEPGGGRSLGHAVESVIP
jgi:hypothetical protein